MPKVRAEIVSIARLTHNAVAATYLGTFSSSGHSLGFMTADTGEGRGLRYNDNVPHQYRADEQAVVAAGYVLTSGREEHMRNAFRRYVRGRHGPQRGKACEEWL